MGKISIDVKKNLVILQNVHSLISRIFSNQIFIHPQQIFLYPFPKTYFRVNFIINLFTFVFKIYIGASCLHQGSHRGGRSSGRGRRIKEGNSKMSHFLDCIHNQYYMFGI